MSEKRICPECGREVKRFPGQSLQSWQHTKFHMGCYTLKLQQDSREKNRRRREKRKQMGFVDVGACALVVLRAIRQVYGNVYDNDFPRRFDEVEKRFKEQQKGTKT